MMKRNEILSVFVLALLIVLAGVFQFHHHHHGHDGVETLCHVLPWSGHECGHHCDGCDCGAGCDHGSSSDDSAAGCACGMHLPDFDNSGSRVQIQNSDYDGAGIFLTDYIAPAGFDFASPVMPVAVIAVPRTEGAVCAYRGACMSLRAPPVA